MCVDYEIDVDLVLSEFDKFGYSYLPSIKYLLEKHDIARLAREEIEGRTYSVDLNVHKKLVSLMGLERLFDGIYSWSKESGHKVSRDDHYFVTRFVKEGQKEEAYRSHFDGHVATIVLPIEIPVSPESACGELKFVPSARKFPRNELLNIGQKAYWKRYANSEGMKELSKKYIVQTEFFDEYRPLLFCGITTFHGNNYLQEGLGNRISMLCHLFDPSPRLGISSTLRVIRNR